MQLSVERIWEDKVLLTDERNHQLVLMASLLPSGLQEGDLLEGSHSDGFVRLEEQTKKEKHEIYQRIQELSKR